jgi:polysaccharide biosynthesis protein PslH
MELRDLKVLYVCTDFPYPPIHGGLVDMWNRIQTLHGLGVTLDLIVTAAIEPPPSARQKVENLVRRLFICKRKPGRRGIISIKPGHAAIRNDLRHVRLEEPYDVVIMQTEFTSEILLNETLKHKVSVIRVDNDEYAFHIQTAKAERSWLKKLYFFQEAFRIRRHTAAIFPGIDMLWFVSHDELGRYNQSHATSNRQRTAFVPSAIDLTLLNQIPLEGSQVLFVGNLWAQFNIEAVEWYVANVHQKLNDVPNYRFAIAGSTRGRGNESLRNLVKPYPNISLHFDPEDLSPFYASSVAFVNPMQKGAGVKLKTIEAILRGLPVVSTKSGAEGSGLIDGEHYKCADTAEDFALRVREFLTDKDVAREFVSRSQSFISEQYDQRKVLGRLLSEVSSLGKLR